MNPKRHRVLYIEKPTESIGGSIIGLYELIHGVDINKYEPVVLLYGPNPYCEKFEALGVKVATLSKESRTAQSVCSPRDIAASLSRYGDWLADRYRFAKQVYLIARRDWPLACRVARLIKDEMIDLVHHNNSLPGNRATIMAARLAGVPQVCHVRMLHIFSSIERYLARFVDAFIYMSKAIEELYRNLGIPAGKGYVVYDGFDLEPFSRSYQIAELRSEFGITDEHRLISNVGRIDWWKGHDYFLQAMSEVIQSHPDARALIVGSPDPGPLNQTYYCRLQQLVADLGLSNHVIFTGYRSDIPRIMAASDIVVHSASEPEPFGRVVVEAMAAGCPVIATAGGGVLEIVEDQATGLLVPPKNSTLMAQAIQELLQNPAQARSIGQCAQEYVQERFSVEQQVTAVQRIYHEVLDPL